MSRKMNRRGIDRKRRFENDESSSSSSNNLFDRKRRHHDNDVDDKLDDVLKLLKKILHELDEIEDEIEDNDKHHKHDDDHHGGCCGGSHDHRHHKKDCDVVVITADAINHKIKHSSTNNWKDFGCNLHPWTPVASALSCLKEKGFKIISTCCVKAGDQGGGGGAGDFDPLVGPAPAPINEDDAVIVFVLVRCDDKCKKHHH